MPDRPISRREFFRRGRLLGAGALGGLVLGCSRYAQRPRANGRPPNILFILTDDQRWDAASYMGHPFLHTPNIDRIAHEGVRFANAFVTTSLCSPSRASFLTGCYAHTHGVVTNDANDPDPACPTFPALLRQRGWETAFIGKWHMAPTAQPRPGFDYWLSFASQGEYIDPLLNENGRDFQATGYMTDILTDYAVRWLSQPRNSPFCLVLSHKAVHGPFTPAARHKTAFADAELPEPPSFSDTLAGKPAWMRRERIYGPRRGQWVASQNRPIPDELPPETWDGRNKYRLDYYRALLAVDESVGRVLEALEKNGQLDSTVVIFASDNGYFQGEHRRGDKRLIYEESIRIPLLVRYPPVAAGGAARSEMILNIDVAPTVLDLAGITVPESMQGRSLRPLLTGGRGEWRRSFLYEYFREAWAPGIPFMLGLRTQRWKYVSYPDIDDIDELYDLNADPYEMQNLAVDPAHAKDLARMRAELGRLLEQTEYPKGVTLGASPDMPPLRPNRPDLLVLAFTWTGEAGGKIADASTLRHDGSLQGTSAARGPEGPARRFAGTDAVDVPRSQTLDPSLGPWTVEVHAMSEREDGVILAHGGQAQGYALTIEGGRPRFYVRTDGVVNTVAADQSVVGRWTHLAGVIGTDGHMKLYVDGRLAGSARLDSLIGMNPNEALTIGTDRSTPVGSYETLGGFVGLMGPVRIFAGERTAEQIAADAAAW